MQTLIANIVAPGEAQTYNVFGVRVEVLAGGAETAAAYCSYVCNVAPGDGPPPHVHSHEDEAFYILEGRFEVLCGDKVTVAEANTFVFLPRGIVHTFKNVGSAPGRFIGTATPAGHEHFFADVDRLCRQGMPSLEEAAAVCLKHGIELALPVPA